MRYRGNIRDRFDLQPHRLDSANGILAARSGTSDDHIHFLDAHCLGSLDGLFSRQAGSEGCALAGSFETHRTSATPTKGVSIRVGYGHDRIVEGCKYMHLSGGQRALSFLGATSAACRTYSLSHNTSFVPLNGLLLAALAASAPGDGLLNTLASAGIGACALSMDRQVAPMTQTAVAADLHQSLDIHLLLAA